MRYAPSRGGSSLADRRVLVDPSRRTHLVENAEPKKHGTFDSTWTASRLELAVVRPAVSQAVGCLDFCGPTSPHTQPNPSDWPYPPVLGSGERLSEKGGRIASCQSWSMCMSLFIYKEVTAEIFGFYAYLSQLTSNPPYMYTPRGIVRLPPRPLP